MGRVIPREGMDNSEVSFNCDRYSRPDLEQNIYKESQIYRKQIKFTRPGAKRGEIFQKKVKYTKSRIPTVPAEHHIFLKLKFLPNL